MPIETLVSRKLLSGGGGWGSSRVESRFVPERLGKPLTRLRKRLHHLGCRLITRRRQLGHELADDAYQPRRRIRAQRAQRYGRCGADLLHEHEDRFASKRRFARAQSVKKAAHAEQVRTMIHVEAGE